ncbi:MAPEG family protein [SAR92 clade bacterium H921]|jgi:uncharacterized MAPEG superfamily protein|nr:MAPEG family protein [SAR92 clade bacterium H921]MDG0970831.1 MAPEG family protein [Porticoccaceae bacterium]MDG1307016.1 MAPEG family protein [Porticoccaceae bacterium]
MPTSMSAVIIAALTLALVQIWLLPIVTNIKNAAYLLTSREEDVETTAVYRRVDRAKKNLQESLPAFLALCLLSIQMEVDNLSLATTWLALRVVYVPLYMTGVSYIRSVVWFSATLCMVMMAMQLV